MFKFLHLKTSLGIALFINKRRLNDFKTVFSNKNIYLVPLIPERHAIRECSGVSADQGVGQLMIGTEESIEKKDIRPSVNN